jgi:hypothetical protein
MKKKANQDISLHSGKTSGTEVTKKFCLNEGNFEGPHEG